MVDNRGKDRPRLRGGMNGRAGWEISHWGHRMKPARFEYVAPATVRHIAHLAIPRRGTMGRSLAHAVAVIRDAAAMRRGHAS